MSSSRSCCILTISSSVAQGKELIERIVPITSAAAITTTESKLELPWTISNKYYTASVHFSVIETRDIKAEDAVDVPACMFVFSLAEDFKEDFHSIITCFKESDFEVSIAVSLSAPDARLAGEGEQDELEEFFGEYGFEYVDGYSIFDPSREHDIDNMEGTPDIGRLVDALSTIMWPSMVQKEGSRRAKARSVVSVPGPPDEEDGLRALLNADKDASSATALQREIAALEKWLEDGANDEKDPWEGQAFESRPEEHSKAEAAHSAVSGFDDNFSDFVSAPVHVEEATNVDDHFALPSQAEIEATSRRIFDMASADILDEGGSHAFDLSRILGSLEAMKEEIASITDEDEKRKAAAKVALGLVYGLEEG